MPSSEILCSIKYIFQIATVNWRTFDVCGGISAMVGGSWVSLADVKDKVGGEFAILYDNPAACMLPDYDLRCLVEGGHRQQGTGPT